MHDPFLTFIYFISRITVRKILRKLAAKSYFLPLMCVITEKIKKGNKEIIVVIIQNIKSISHVINVYNVMYIKTQQIK